MSAFRDLGSPPSSSGSHFNPPFTIAIYLCGGIELTTSGLYLVSQLIGGVLGAGMAKVRVNVNRTLFCFRLHHTLATQLN